MLHLNIKFSPSSKFPQFHNRPMNTFMWRMHKHHIGGWINNFLLMPLCYQVNWSIGLNIMRSVKLVKTRIRYLILHSLSRVKKASNRPRSGMPVPAIISLATAMYWTRNKTLSWSWIARTNCWFHLKLALFVSFPPWQERIFPWFLSLFLFGQSFLSIFFWMQWWALETYFSCMVSCFL